MSPGAGARAATWWTRSGSWSSWDGGEGRKTPLFATKRTWNCSWVCPELYQMTINQVTGCIWYLTAGSFFSLVGWNRCFQSPALSPTALLPSAPCGPPWLPVLAPSCTSPKLSLKEARLHPAFCLFLATSLWNLRSWQLNLEDAGCSCGWTPLRRGVLSNKSRLTSVLCRASAVEFKCRVNWGTQILKLSLKWFEEQTGLWQAGREYVNSWPPAVLRARSLKAVPWGWRRCCLLHAA